MKYFTLTIFSFLSFFISLAQLKTPKTGIQSVNLNNVKKSSSIDTTKGYFLIKPGLTEVFNGNKSEGSTALLKFDSTGLSLFRNDTALVKFWDFPISEQSNFPFLTMNPITKELNINYLQDRLSNLLPDQNGHAGKILKTNGQVVSWHKLPEIYAKDYDSVYPGSDYSIIQTAVNNAGTGDKIYLDNRVYELNSGIFITKSVEFVGQGNTIIRRGNERISALKMPLQATGNFLIVSNPEYFQEGDQLVLFKDSTWWGATQRGFINKVSGDTVFLNNAIGTYNGESNTVFAAGTKIRKVFNLFSLSAVNDIPAFSTGFTNITFEGNRENNRANLGYHHSWAIVAQGKTPTRIINCTFKDMPTESITGHNFFIENSIFKDLNGSALHFTLNRKTTDSIYIHSEISNCLFINTNQVSSAAVTSHSEGVFTTSNSGGYFSATKNKFRNCGEAIIGALYPSLSEHDYGTNQVIFSNNYIDSTKRLIYLVDWSTPGTISGVIVKDNSLTRIQEDIDLSQALSMAGREAMIIQGYNSIPQSETLNLLAQSGALPGQTIKWNGLNWVAEDEVGNPSGVDGNLQFNMNGMLEADSILTWDASSKKLGIGTANPKSNLHIKGYGELMMLETTSPPGTGTGYFSFYDSLERKGFIGYGNTNNDQLSIFNERNADMQLATNGVSGQFILKPDGSIGIGTASPHSSAILQLQSTTRGFLPPRLSEAQKDAISGPATGLMVYNLTSNTYEYFNGSEWLRVGADTMLDGIKTINEANYILSDSDFKATLTFSANNPVTVIIPSGLQKGFVCNFIQIGQGNVQVISGGGGVVVLNRQGFTKTAGQYAEGKLSAIDANRFVLSGDLKN